MLEFICAIPEEIGWALVGSVATITAMLAYRLVSEIVVEVKARMAERKAEASRLAKVKKNPKLKVLNKPTTSLKKSVN
jgi:hypothetical protein